MQRLVRFLVLVVLVLIVGQPVAGVSPLFAQGGKTSLSPEERQKKYEEHMRSAREAEMTGYILAGAAFLLVFAMIPLSIYLDRKKKARKKALEAEARQAERKRDR